MKKLLLLLITTFAALAASAQSYIRLWQKPLDDYRKSAVGIVRALWREGDGSVNSVRQPP